MGLSHYGYTNLRNYVYYRESPVRDRLMMDAQFQYKTSYFEEGQYDMLHESVVPKTFGNSWVTAPHDKTQFLLGIL
ncbi:MAG: hypothetical protein LRZ88_02970 [Candidatus Cloacimonetes bacterium]|nr:hypothetical protein [Candidatus Cloacimonadota bacterium]